MGTGNVTKGIKEKKITMVLEKKRRTARIFLSPETRETGLLVGEWRYYLNGEQITKEKYEELIGSQPGELPTE